MRTRTYSQEFKQEAVRLVKESGMSCAKVGKDIGVCKSTIAKWVQQDRRNGGKEEALLPSEREELKRLRRENKQLKMERDILKKATVFFAKHEA